LYHDPSQPYIDFYIYTNFRAIAITIVSAYNYTAGLAAVQVFTDGTPDLHQKANVLC